MTHVLPVTPLRATDRQLGRMVIPSITIRPGVRGNVTAEEVIFAPKVVRAWLGE
ncbi:hypothetical protein GCM10027073_46510 [Streptomyces chlorus]|uniref:Uncharacterized protein n=1 Tax=Streptomyces chlorus TaxID=887452 RepID=A0ABW1E0F7_9ACTN